jgi:hypothetical protein
MNFTKIGIFHKVTPRVWGGVIVFFSFENSDKGYPHAWVGGVGEIAPA